MDIWDMLIVIYGLVISPIAGVRLVKMRWKTDLKEAKSFWIYLLYGLTILAITMYSTYLVMGHYPVLIIWGYIVIFGYIVVYGAPKHWENFPR